MGNEDVVVCKNKCIKSPTISDCAIVETDKKDIVGTDMETSTNEDNEEKRVDFVQILPMELIVEIFVYLGPKDLASCAKVSSAWREGVNSNKVWGYLCDSKGWKDDFDPNFSHFYRAHKQFRKWAHSYDSFTPICQKRLLYNKHSCLQKNWRCGKYVVHKISNASQSIFQLFEPVTCDGRYLVMLEKSKLNQKLTLAVWSLDGVPFKLCDLSLPSKVHGIEAIAFDRGTIAVAQSWIIIVYQLQNNRFEEVYTKYDLSILEPKTKLPKDMKRMIPYLKVTENYVICVPNYSHSTVDYIPIFFWDKNTGELQNTLNFDSMYFQISNAIWFEDSCFLAITNRKKKSYQIVEFTLKTVAWAPFSQSVIVEIEHIAVSSQYVLAVTKASNQAQRDYFLSRGVADNNKELWLWDRVTGSALKTFEAQGKSFQFVDDYVLYFDSSRVTVMNPKASNMCSEFEVSGTISSIRASCHSSIMVIIKTGCYIEVWDWGLGCRLYTITAETGYGSQVWCDDKRIITYHSSDGVAGGGILVLGFW